MNATDRRDIRQAVTDAAAVIAHEERARELMVDDQLSPSVRHALVREQYLLASAAKNRVIGRLGQMHEIADAAMDAAHTTCDLAIEAADASAAANR